MGMLQEVGPLLLGWLVVVQADMRARAQLSCVVQHVFAAKCTYIYPSTAISRARLPNGAAKRAALLMASAFQQLYTGPCNWGGGRRAPQYLHEFTAKGPGQ